MATIAQGQDEEQQPGQGNQPAPTSGTSAPSGSGTGVGVGANTVSNVQQNAAPQNGQGYTDVASYLNANQQGGAQLGNQVASNLTNQYNTTKSGIDTSANAANQSVSQGYIPENTQLIQQVSSNPTAAAGNADQLSAFQGQLNDTYGGPTSWADYGTQQGNVNQAIQNASLVNTPGGNNALIQQVENQNQPGHTSQGINSLDTLLYQGNPGGVQAAKAAAQPYQTLNDYINAANTGIGTNIANATNAANQTSQDALNAFTGSNGTLTNLNNTINTTAANDLSQAQAQQAQLKTDLGGLYSNGNIANTALGIQNYNVGQLSPQDLASLGMTQDQATQLQQALQNAGTSQYKTGHNFGASSQTAKSDLLSYLQQQDPTQAISAANTATPEQYAQMAAIQQLLGSKTPQGTAINPLNASQAGTYNPANLNQFDFNTATSDASNFATQAQQQAQAEADALTAQADAAHAASKHGGGLLGGIKQAVTHPLNTVASVFNPVSWAANAQNLAKGQGPNPTNLNPLKPTTNNALTDLAQKTPQGQLIDKYLLDNSGKVK
jgi:hypothetical protein